MTPGALIELRDVRAFAGATPVSLCVGRGERVALLGRNGIGKTTLLRAIAGLTRPADGSVRAPPTVGFMPQEYRASLLPWLSVADNVALPLRGQRLSTAARSALLRDARAAASLPDALLPRSPQQLSGGEQQRVALARSLAWRASVVLLDEPLSALDGSTRASLRRDLSAFMEARDTGCLLVSHDLDDVLGLATRWVVLGDVTGAVVDEAQVSAGRAGLTAALLAARSE
jgi:NitT/TauT family transport system ATP-binding protein